MSLLKEKYRQFRQWQQQPFDYHDTHEHHGCCNCGAESENNYCPRCGQKTRTKVDESEAAYIGFSGQDITPQVMMLYNVPQGIYVTDVAEDSPAEKAGLEVDMIITGFDGHTISDMDDLRSILEYYAGGETVKLSVAVQNRYGYVNDELELTLGLKRDYLNEGAAYGEDS